MKLSKYTWNNGTQSSPIILTNDQIKMLDDYIKLEYT